LLFIQNESNRSRRITDLYIFARFSCKKELPAVQLVTMFPRN